jgi:hypothetical protein
MKMKKVKLILASLFFVMFVASCEKDGGDSVIPTGEGATVNIQKVVATEAFINLVSINDNTPIDLGFTVDIGFGDVASADIVMFYYSGDNVYKATYATDVTTFPTTFNISQDDILDAFTELNSAADIQVGDALTVTAELTLTDGTVVKMLNDDGSANYGADIANSALFSVVQTYNVSCPSDLGGVYQYITTNSSAPTGESSAGPDTGTVTFEDQGGGVYEISDASFGGWIGLYGPGNIATGVTLTDICNQISYTGVDQYGEIFTFSNLVVNGNQMSFHWENDYGEFGDTTLIRTDGTDWPPLYL